MKNLGTMGVQEMNTQEMKKVDGGFFPLVIFGIYLSSKVVAGIIIGTFAVGVGVGISVAASD